MDPNIAAALQGTLGSSTSGANPQPASIANRTDVNLLLYWLAPTGTQCGYDTTSGEFREGLPGFPLTAGSGVDLGGVTDGTFFLLRAAHSGAFATLVEKNGTPPAGGFLIDCGQFLDPGLVGPIPQPTQDRPIPVDSPRVLVGCGSLANGGSVAREQFWHLTGDSYSLAPKDSVTTSLTQTSGMENTSSEQTTLSQSLNVSVSGGWGPISASVSAALSRSSATFQQVTVTEQQTAFRSVQRTNDTAAPVTYLLWQLTDVVTVFDANDVPTASIVTSVQPVIIEGPYPPPAELAATAARAQSTPEMRAAAPSLRGIAVPALT